MDAFIGLIFKEGAMDAQIAAFMSGARPFVKAVYQHYTPVMEGKLRGSVVDRVIDPLEFSVEATAENNGFPYGQAVHWGSGAYYMHPGDWPSTGRVNAGETMPGAGGIRPNKWVIRAAHAVNYVLLERLMGNLQTMSAPQPLAFPTPQ